MYKMKVLSTALCIAGAGMMPASADTSSHRISVVGEGAVTAVPDMLEISLSVQATAADASAAMREMATDLDAVLVTLMESGIPEDDLQTSGISLSPRYANTYETNEAPRITGFVASSDIAVTSRELSAAGAILDAVVVAGADQLNSLRFDVQDRAALEDDARRAAVADAIRKTTLYAQAAKITTGSILSISEIGTSGGGGPQMFETLGARSVAIAPGTLDITAQVSVVTEIVAQ